MLVRLRGCEKMNYPPKFMGHYNYWKKLAKEKGKIELLIITESPPRTTSTYFYNHTAPYECGVRINDIYSNGCFSYYIFESLNIQQNPNNKEISLNAFVEKFFLMDAINVITWITAQEKKRVIRDKLTNPIHLQEIKDEIISLNPKNIVICGRAIYRYLYPHLSQFCITENINLVEENPPLPFPGRSFEHHNLHTEFMNKMRLIIENLQI